jgi:Cu-Zn family superoxide dismutase
MKMHLFVGCAVAGVVYAAGTGPAGTATASLTPVTEASARVIDRNATNIGVVLFQQTKTGVRIDINLSRLPAGAHAVHIHAVGTCEPANGFRSAGAHFDVGGHKHGRMAPGGPHTGDMENQTVNRFGFMRATVKTTAFTLSPGPASVLDLDGSAFVVHAGIDDYKTNPDGKGGERIACGVIKAM